MDRAALVDLGEKAAAAAARLFAARAHAEAAIGERKQGVVTLFGRLAARVMAQLPAAIRRCGHNARRSEEHTSELQSLMRISYAVFCLKKKKNKQEKQEIKQT